MSGRDPAPAPSRDTIEIEFGATDLPDSLVLPILMKSIEERSRARRQSLTANRAQSFEEADEWDLDFWQSRTPQERLSALVALRRDVELVEAARRSRSAE